jgi:hypothetical protein
MGKHSSRDNSTGRFAKVNPETDVAAPGAGVPSDFAYDEVRRYAPAADELAQGGQQHLAGRSPIEINGDTGESFGQRMSEVPGLPGEIFGGTGIVRHDVAHGGHQRPLPHRRQALIDAQSGQALDARIISVPGADPYASPKTSAHLAAAEGDPFARNLVGPMTGPETRSTRRTPGTDGYKVPSNPAVAHDRDAEWKGGR